MAKSRKTQSKSDTNSEVNCAQRTLAGTLGKPSKLGLIPANFGRFGSAYQQLRDEITAGDYLPNQRLVEADLTRSLGVSRTTVRAVLMRLEEDGLVDIEPKRGARVRSVTLEEALRILKVREVLEGLAASLAAVNATDVHLGRLSAIIEDMNKAIVEENPLQYSALNGNFHDTILEAANHDALSRAINAVHFPLLRYRWRTVLIPGRKEKSLIEHRKILDCLIKRDAKGAEQSIRHHLACVGAVLADSKNLLAI